MPGTDAAGRFRLERLLEDETLEVVVAKVGFATLRSGGLRAGSRDLRLVLAPASP